MKRLNITIPKKVSEAIEVYENKSKFITEAITEKIEKEAEEKLDRKLTEGYKQEYNSDQKTNSEWEDVTLEGWPN